MNDYIFCALANELNLSPGEWPCLQWPVLLPVTGDPAAGCLESGSSWWEAVLGALAFTVAVCLSIRSHCLAGPACGLLEEGCGEQPVKVPRGSARYERRYVRTLGLAQLNVFGEQFVF